MPHEPPQTKPLSEPFVLLAWQTWVVACFPIVVFALFDSGKYGDGGLAGMAAGIRASALLAVVEIPLIMITLISISRAAAMAKGQKVTALIMQAGIVMIVFSIYLSFYRFW